jgi:hypothetical protein
MVPNSDTLSPLSDTVPCHDCQVCGTKLPAPVLNLGLQPMCDDLIQIGSASTCVEYPIQISLCPRCLTAHQAFNIRKELLFSPSYHYRPRFTQDVLDGMKQLVAQCETELSPVAGKIVCDIGCNDGSLLNFFRERGATTCGIEPTRAGLEARTAGHYIENSYFDRTSAQSLTRHIGKPDFITFTNVFAHIQDLDETIEALKLMVKADTVVVIENHYLGTVLATNQFDTFYHEHPRTYSVRSFEHIAARLGGRLLSATFPKRYGGNIRVCIGGFGDPAGAPAPVSTPDESGFPEKMAAMQAFVEDWRGNAKRALSELKAQGVSLHGKSFPGRAAILVTLLEMDAGLMPVVYEKPGSMKIGHWLPGTRIEIQSDECWISGQAQPDAMLIWGWHIAAEIAGYMRKNGYRGRIFSPLPEFHEVL